MVSVAFLLLLLLQMTVEAARHTGCPADCSCLGNMVDCSKKRLKRMPDDLPAWVQVLDISSNSIARIQNEDLEGLIHLEEINLSANKLTNLNGNVLLLLPSIQILKLTHNHLSQIPEFNSPINITHLDLGHNAISQVNETCFQYLRNVRSIDLGFNALTHLRNGALSSLWNLRHLFLISNEIESIERGAFDNISSLEWLKLNKNRLTTLPSNVFSHLPKLLYLEINQNHLKKIEGLRFQGLVNLLSLRLRRNQLSELMDGAFFGLAKIETLQLDFNNLSRITSGFLFGLETLMHLSVTHNIISQIETDSWSFCRRLTELDLSHNHLSAVTELMFMRLESLQILRLNHNRISYITENAFRDLASLKTLDLSRNQLSSALEDTDSVFSTLTSLTRLSLDGNNIKSVSVHTFKGLSHLKQLNLMGNAITSIQENAFDPLKNLEQLRFNSTNFLCDCLLSWLPVWLQGTGFQVSVHGQCAHPETFRGQNILEVNGSSFKCDDFARPVIKKDPQSQIALRDGTLNFTCVAVSSSSSQLTIEWKKDHVILSNAVVETVAQRNKNGLIEYTSRLLLRPVKDEHAGFYQCVVSNALGTSYSAKAEITVGVYPRFWKIPGDVTVKAGSTARLDCAASGQPAPEIAWQKDGGDDFPAARERRMHVMPSDDVFFIVEVKNEDQGVYTCTAKNDAGFVKANATLMVVQAPSFSKTSKEKSAAEGETAVLECMSSRPGVRPRLEWLKDGRPLSLTPRHYFAGDGQILVIRKTQPGDSGEYTCIMTNPLGSERAVLHFAVHSTSQLALQGNSSEGSRSDDITRIGIIVIVVVVCIVGTSLLWVIMIYCLRMKQRGRQAIKKTLPCRLYPLNDDVFIANNNSRRGVAARSVCSTIRGTKRLLSDPSNKCSPGVDCYAHNSCRCQDSGCFCTDFKYNEKSSHIRLTMADDAAGVTRSHWFPPVDEYRQHAVLSMPELCTNNDRLRDSTGAYHSLNLVLQNPERHQTLISSCIKPLSGWHTASDSNLSTIENRCQTCRNALSPQKVQRKQSSATGQRPLTDENGDIGKSCQCAPDPAFVAKSCHLNSLRGRLIQEL